MNRGLALFGTLALALAALTACGGDDSDDSGGFNEGGAADEAARPQTTSAAAGATAAPASGGNQTTTNSGSTGSGGGQPAAQIGELDRKIIVTASIALTVDDLAGTFSEANSIARASGGYVEESNYSEVIEEDGERKLPQTATLKIRVPAAAHGTVLDQLRGMAGVKVAREGQRAQEVTEQYTDLVSRQRNLQRSEQQYLTLLGQAKTIPEIITVQDKIDAVRAQIEQIQGRLNVLDDLTALATIDVALTLPAAPAVKTEKPADDGKGGPPAFTEVFADAWDASVTAARYVANAAAVLLVAVIWLGLPALLIGGTALAISRRHRPTPEAQG